MNKMGQQLVGTLYAETMYSKIGDPNGRDGIIASIEDQEAMTQVSLWVRRRSGTALVQIDMGAVGGLPDLLFLGTPEELRERLLPPLDGPESTDQRRARATTPGALHAMGNSKGLKDKTKQYR